MRHAATALLAASALAVAATACGSAAPTPGEPTGTFNAGARLLVYSQISCFGTGTSVTEAGKGCPAHVSVVGSSGEVGSPALSSVKAGTIMAVSNVSGADQRVTGTIRSTVVFDTGSMHTGQQTIVELDTPGRMSITVASSGERTSLVVEPRPKST
jgi:hypothetical protein